MTAARVCRRSAGLETRQRASCAPVPRQYVTSATGGMRSAPARQSAPGGTGGRRARSFPCRQRSEDRPGRATDSPSATGDCVQGASAHAGGVSGVSDGGLPRSGGWRASCTHSGRRTDPASGRASAPVLRQCDLGQERRVFGLATAGSAPVWQPARAVSSGQRCGVASARLLPSSPTPNPVHEKVPHS
jgi:hypothetical protein